MKVGTVGVVGKPNAGKSSLVNKIVGFDVAITTPKPQTTRFNIRGIYTSETSQIVFVDTPGIHKAKNKLGEYMMQGVKIAVDNVDLVVLMVDAMKSNLDEKMQGIIQNLVSNNIKVILCINKIDSVKKENILEIIATYNKYILGLKSSFIAIVPLSVKKNDGVTELVKIIEQNLLEGEPIYEADEVTDMLSRDIASETIRGVMLNFLDEEVPHAVNIEILEMQENTTLNDNLVYNIEANIICKRDSHKSIIIGKDASMLKRIKEESIKRLYKTLGVRCKLKLWVKVRSDWDSQEAYLKNIKDKIR